MPHQLKALRARNVDLYTAAIRCVAAGDYHQLRRLGLTERLIPYLLHLSPAEALRLADDGLDLAVWLRLSTRKRADELLRLALIEHGAPRDLMVQMFGMSTRHYAAERRRLGLAVSGRPHIRTLDTATEHRLWRLWVVLADPQDPARLRQPEHWLLIAREMPQRLRSAWALIRRWSRDDDARKAFAGDRARLSRARLRQAEHELRARHGLLASAAADGDEPADGPVTETRPPPSIQLAA